MADVLLPPSATELERVAAEACADAEDLFLPIRDTWSPAACPSPLLPWLAWEFGVDEWDGTWANERQRVAITTSIPVKRIKGTVGAVRDALGAIGFQVRVQEWFAQIPAGAPYTYRLLLEVDQVGYDLPGLERLLRVVERTKNLRSHLDTVIPIVTTRAGLTAAVVTNVGNEITVGYSVPIYADGAPALDLLTDAAINGDASTNGAIDTLHTVLNETMPQPAYW